jgi:N-acyl-D-aspartate/D-glutamate deacylase
MVRVLQVFEAMSLAPVALAYSCNAAWTVRAWKAASASAASANDMEVMTRELGSALQAGSAGFTTSRRVAHQTSDGRPVASRLAAWDEVAALVEVLGREDTAVFQLAMAVSLDPGLRAQEHRRGSFRERRFPVNVKYADLHLDGLPLSGRARIR